MISSQLIDKLEKKIKINTYTTYLHVAAIIIKNDIISIGINYFPNCDDMTIHAEVNAINKLKNNKGKLKNVNLVVIRFSPNLYLLGNSKCCIECILKMSMIRQKGYRINKVFYSTEYGSITKISFSKLKNDKNFHICKNSKNKNKKFII